MITPPPADELHLAEHAPRIESALIEIERRVQTATYAAIHVCNNPSVWERYYADNAKDTPLLRDFMFMLRYCRQLESERTNLRYLCESNGIDPDKEGA